MAEAVLCVLDAFTNVEADDVEMSSRCCDGGNFVAGEVVVGST
jgi:hypothetical protein